LWVDILKNSLKGTSIDWKKSTLVEVIAYDTVFLHEVSEHILMERPYVELNF